MLAFAGCLDIFITKKQKVLRKIPKKEKFEEKKLVYQERRIITKSPWTLEDTKVNEIVLGDRRNGVMD